MNSPNSCKSYSYFKVNYETTWIYVTQPSDKSDYAMQDFKRQQTLKEQTFKHRRAGRSSGGHSFSPTFSCPVSPCFPAPRCSVGLCDWTNAPLHLWCPCVWKVCLSPESSVIYPSTDFTFELVFVHLSFLGYFRLVKGLNHSIWAAIEAQHTGDFSLEKSHWQHTKWKACLLGKISILHRSLNVWGRWRNKLPSQNCQLWHSSDKNQMLPKGRSSVSLQSLED